MNTSNYRAIGGLWEDIKEAFTSDPSVPEDWAKDEAFLQSRCPAGTTFTKDSYLVEKTGGYQDILLKEHSCVVNDPSSCPSGYRGQLKLSPSTSPSSPLEYPSGFTSNDVECIDGDGYKYPYSKGNPAPSDWGNALTGGGGIASFFSNLLGGGSAPSPAEPVTIAAPPPGTPVVADPPASPSLAPALLVLGLVGLVGGTAYWATR